MSSVSKPGKTESIIGVVKVSNVDVDYFSINVENQTYTYADLATRPDPELMTTKIGTKSNLCEKVYRDDYNNKLLIVFDSTQILQVKEAMEVISDFSYKKGKADHEWDGGVGISQMYEGNT